VGRVDWTPSEVVQGLGRAFVEGKETAEAKETVTAPSDLWQRGKCQTIVRGHVAVGGRRGQKEQQVLGF
jgi:hypothetical protein